MSQELIDFSNELNKYFEAEETEIVLTEDEGLLEMLLELFNKPAR